MAALLQHIILCWVAPGMTPVVQLTDTDFSFLLKRHLEAAKWEIAQKLKEKALREGREFTMKFGAAEIMFIVCNAVRSLKTNAEAHQLGIFGLRRNGQLAVAPFEGKMVEITEEKFPWAAKFPQIGGHRYPSSWLENRMQHIEDGVPKAPEWKEVLLNHERRSGLELGAIEEESKEALEQKILEHLGEIKFETQDGRIAADHEVKLCGNMVKIPVLRLDIGDQEGLISEELLEKLNKTPKQRRAEASGFTGGKMIRGTSGEKLSEFWAGAFA